MSHKSYTTTPDKEEKKQRELERRVLVLLKKHRPLVSSLVTSSKKEAIILIGGGGHCRSCIDVIEMEGRFAIRGILAANESLRHPILTHDLLGKEEDIQKLSKTYRHFFITVGQIKEWAPRVRLYNYLKSLHDAVIEDHCHISTAAVVNGGTTVKRCSFVGSKAVIREGIEVGEACIIGAGVAVMHSLQSGSLQKYSPLLTAEF